MYIKMRMAIIIFILTKEDGKIIMILGVKIINVKAEENIILNQTNSL